jgi:transcriptional regulator with GAF, ATPase, and Fis domain
VDIVCLNYLSPDPSKAAKALVRRIKRRWPQVRVVLALWNSTQLSPIPQGLSVTESTEGGPTAAVPRWGDVTVVESIAGSVVELEQMMGTSTDTVFTPAPVPDGDALRVEALHASGALRSEPMQRLFASAAKRAADVFDVPFAMVSLVDRHRQITRASYGALDGPNTSEGHQSLEAGLPRDQAPCSYVVADSALMCVTDVSRDTRFAGNPSLRQLGIGFYAGAPLKDASKNVWGTLCLMDSAPRKFDRREQRLLQAMAQDLMVTVQQIESEADIPTGVARVPESNDGEAPSASVGQVVPT